MRIGNTQEIVFYNSRLSKRHHHGHDVDAFQILAHLDLQTFATTKLNRTLAQRWISLLWIISATAT